MALHNVITLSASTCLDHKAALCSCHLAPPLTRQGGLEAAASTSDRCASSRLVSLAGFWGVGGGAQVSVHLHESGPFSPLSASTGVMLTRV